MSIIIGVTALGSFLTLSLLLVGLQRKLLYFPSHHAAARPLPAARPLSIDGGVIDAWLINAERIDEAPLVIYCGGNAEDAAASAEQWRARGWPTLLWNYPSYGTSQGRPTEAGIIAAGAQVLKYVQHDLGLPPARCVIVGRSLGAAVALALAEQQQPGALVLVTPFLSVDAMAARHYPWIPRLLILDHWRSDQRIAGMRCPITIIAAQADEIIPPAQAEALAQLQTNSELITIENAGHNDIHFFDAYWDHIARVLRRQTVAGDEFS